MDSVSSRPQAILDNPLTRWLIFDGFILPNKRSEKKLTTTNVLRARHLQSIT